MTYRVQIARLAGKMGHMLPEEAHVLYRYFTAAGELLYVGITNNPWNRNKSHERSKAWFSEYAYQTAEHFDSRSELEDAEKRAIQTELPKYNRAHSVAPVGPHDLDAPVRVKEVAVANACGRDANWFQQPGEEDTRPTPAAPGPLRLAIPCVECFAPFVFQSEKGTIFCRDCGEHQPLPGRE